MNHIVVRTLCVCVSAVPLAVPRACPVGAASCRLVPCRGVAAVWCRVSFWCRAVLSPWWAAAAPC
eukprot:6300022-Pyramimonas_sp.AAC.1